MQGSMAHKFQYSIVTLLVLCVVVQACAQDAQKSFPESTIRVNVNRVNVGVSVTDSRGQFIQGLKREDFRVFDNGVEQPVTGFLSANDPGQVVILLEGGPAAFYLGKDELKSSAALLGSISPSDRLAIVDYANHAQLMLDFTTDRTVARETLERLAGKSAVGGKEVNLAESLGETLDWLVGMPGKKTVVLL